MRAVRLLRYAIDQKPETVLDVGGGMGSHAKAFISNGAHVTGLDVTPPQLSHDKYEHVCAPYETVDFEDRRFDMVWCSHVIEHVPNVQHFLIFLRRFLKDDGWLCIAAPTCRQNRLHVGHLSLWTPAHLVYNLVCAGWNCKEALHYTEYMSIGLAVKKTEDIDLSWRTSLPGELFHLNQFTPRGVHHNDGAWWGNRWPDEFTSSRCPDPPLVTIGHSITNLPPEQQFYFGPNPALRKPPGAEL